MKNYSRFKNYELSNKKRVRENNSESEEEADWTFTKKEKLEGILFNKIRI